jgi:hypothetical protein
VDKTAEKHQPDREDPAVRLGRQTNRPKNNKKSKLLIEYSGWHIGQVIWSSRFRDRGSSTTFAPRPRHQQVLTDWSTRLSIQIKLFFWSTVSVK